jgi:carboxyl-terminal processing protease
MAMRLRISILGLSVVIAFYVVVGGLLPRYGVVVNNNDPYSQFQIFQEVLNRVVNDYVDEPDLERVRVGALRGLAEGLDPYSAYLTPEQVKRMSEVGSRISDSKTPSSTNPTALRNPLLEGETGMVVSKVAGYVYVVSVIAGSPAEAVGVRPGDVVEYIGTRATRDMSLYEAEEQLSGPVGREVELKVFTRGSSETYRLRLERVARPKPEVRVISDSGNRALDGSAPASAGLPTAFRQPSDGRVGYLKVGTLDEGAGDTIAAELDGLLRQGVDRLVVDLRRVARGQIKEAIRVANLFIGAGPLGRTVGRDGRVIETFEAVPERQRFHGRLVALIDRSTMGAAEVVAAALLESRRGEVVGERTFGGGGEQQLFRLRDGGALWLTTVKYAGPKGTPMMGAQGAASSGVMPTVEVRRPERGLRPEELEEQGAESRRQGAEGPGSKGEDAQLKRAIEILQTAASGARKS